MSLSQAVGGVTLLRDPCFLLIELCAGDGEALQLGRGFRFGLSAGRAARRPASPWRVAATAAVEVRETTKALRLHQGFFGGFQPRLGIGPQQVEQDRFLAADMVLQVAVARGLPRLLLQHGELAFQRDDDIVKAREVGFRRLQPQLGLVPAANAGR
jgi:hypothetical protein